MGEDKRVDELLDQWDEVILQTPQADLDSFVRQHCRDLDGKLQAHFRNKATALAKMNRRLEALQDTNNLSSNTSQSFQSVDILKDLEPGYEPIDGYKLVQRLGRGGFGEVWKATDARGFSVAIKFVDLRGPCNTTEFRSLDIIKDVRHPHLSSIFHAQLRNDTLIIAMELADRTLLDRLEEAKKEGYDGVPQDELFEYMTEAAKGIDFLNEPGSSGRPRIQHCDIKPANLLLSGNSVKIADFGLAQALTFNVVESIGSTPAYAAPEFLDGNTTSTSDQYSLAITYCHLRGGRLPFEGSLTDLMEAHRNADPDLSMIPSEERPAVTRALAKKPKDRWASCTEFVSALKGNSEEQSVAGLLKALPAQAKFIAGLVASLVAVSLLIFVIGFFGGDRQRPAAEQDTAQTQPSGENNSQELTVAVLYFENQSPNQNKLDVLAKGLCSMMITRLDETHQYDLVERERLQEVLDELKLTRSAMFDQKNVASIGKLVGARLLVLGSYFQFLNAFRIDARLVDVETGVTVSAVGVEGKSDEFSVLLSQLVDQLVHKHQGVIDAESQESDIEKPEDDGVSRGSLDLVSDLGEAVSVYDRGEVDAALTRLDAIIEANPEFDEARKLRKRWGERPRKSNSDPERKATHARK